MEIVIKIPEEFEEHFKLDRFEDSLSRVASVIESFGFQLAGRYELETVTMLRDAIKNGVPLSEHHGRIIDESKIESCYYYIETVKNERFHIEHPVITGTDAPTIIERSEDE